MRVFSIGSGMPALGIMLSVMLLVFVTPAEAQMRAEFQACVLSTCSKQLLACQTSSEKCGANMETFRNCESTNSSCQNNQSVAEDGIKKAVLACVDVCKVSDATTEFQNFMDCVKICRSCILSALSTLGLLALVFFM